MGFLFAALVFAVSGFTVIHVNHLDQHLDQSNQKLEKKVQILETQDGGNGVQIDGVSVRNLDNA